MLGILAVLLVGPIFAPAMAQHGGGRGTGGPTRAGPIRAWDEPALLPDLAAQQQALEAAGWMLRGQSTFVQQFHPAFRAPYRGDNSLGAGDQGRNTLSLDILLGRRLWQGAEFILDPQISRGFGLSGTRGLAAFPNGEAFRVGSDGPTLYVARAFLRQTIALSGERDVPEHDPLRFAGACRASGSPSPWQIPGLRYLRRQPLCA